jgi:hypothetical protein
MTTVTGRNYVRTRPRGFTPWTPNPESQELLDQVTQVLTQFREHLPLTARQIFYVLVGTTSYEKTERAYARLCERLSRARRAQLIPFDAIRDDGTAHEAAGGWSSVDRFWPSVRSWARSFQLDRSLGQPRRIELWVEAEGMLPQAARVARRFGVDVYSAGGFNGLTDKYETAQRLAWESRETVVLHVGDYDPSGCAIIDSLAEDVLAFVGGINPDRIGMVQFDRIAVLPEHIDTYGLATAPQKSTDVRGEHMPETVQAEALPPDILAQLVEDAIAAYTDLDALAQTEVDTINARTQLLERMEQMGL